MTSEIEKIDWLKVQIGDDIDDIESVEDVVLYGKGNNMLSFEFNFEENFVKWTVGGHWQTPTKQEVLEFAERLTDMANRLEDE